MTLRRQPILLRHHPAANKQIRMSVTVEVAGGNARSILRQCRQRSRGFGEVAGAIVHIQAIAKRIHPAPELVATADNKQVRMPIAVGIEERRVHILTDAVGSEDCAVRHCKRSVLLLHEQSPWLPFCAAGIDVVESVAVHIADGQRRSFGGQQMRHQRLAIHVVEIVLDMCVVSTDAVGDVHQQRVAGALRGVVPGAACVALRQSQPAIRRHIRQHLKAAIGPDHDQRVDHRVATEAEVQPLIHR